MIPKKGGLGRGLDALLGAATRGQLAVESSVVTETLRQLPVEGRKTADETDNNWCFRTFAMRL